MNCFNNPITEGFIDEIKVIKHNSGSKPFIINRTFNNQEDNNKLSQILS